MKLLPAIGVFILRAITRIRQLSRETVARTLVLLLSIAGILLAVSDTLASPHMDVLSLQIGASTDDADETTVGVIDVDRTFARIQAEGAWAGLRFLNVTIPQTTVNSATLEIWVYDTDYDDIVINVYGHDADDSATFSDAVSSDISGRDLTSESVQVNQTDVAASGDTWFSIDVTDIVNEIVARPGWSSGNAMSFALEGLFGVALRFRPWDNFPGESAKLTIDYTPEATDTPTPTNTPTPTATPTLPPQPPGHYLYDDTDIDSYSGGPWNTLTHTEQVHVSYQVTTNTAASDISWDVTLPTTGTYRLDYHCLSGVSTVGFELFISASPVGGTYNLCGGSTGWETAISTSWDPDFTLDMVVLSDPGQFLIDAIRFVDPSTPTPTPTATPSLGNTKVITLPTTGDVVLYERTVSAGDVLVAAPLWAMVILFLFLVIWFSAKGKF